MRRVLNVILVVVAIVFLGLGIREVLMFSEAEGDKNSLIERVVKVPKESQVDVDFDRQIDFKALKGINEDIVGWIYIPGTQVDYPILIGDNDVKYLNTNYEGKSSELGSIFAYSGVELNKDRHICLFGHNMISGQMFGELDKYEDNDYAYGHMKMYIYTPNRTKECTLISAFGCDKYDGVFELDKTSKDVDTEKLQDSLFERSVLDLVTFKNTGQVFTLGTCRGTRGTSQRFTVSFKVTKEKYVLE